MKICGIYKITNPSNNIYVGQSIDIIFRWNYYNKLRCKGQTKLYNSLKKYGVENHKFEILCQCDRSELNNLEVYYIDLYQSFNTEMGLNLQSGGSVNKVSDETRAKMSASAKAKIITDEHMAKLKASRLGRVYTKGRRFKLSKEACDKKRGENNPFYGKKHSQETKDKIGSRVRSKEYREKLGNGNRGRVLSDKWKDNIRNAVKGEKNGMFGKTHTKEVRERLSLINSNRSLEHLAMMSEQHAHERKAVIQIDKKTQIPIAEYISIKEAHKKAGIDMSQISACCKKKKGYLSAGGYLWEYKVKK